MKFLLVLMFAFLAVANAQIVISSSNSSSSVEESGEETVFTPVRVSIYYNALCTDTARFITNQLLPVYAELKPYIDLFFIPFGKAYSVDHGEYFICQFGPAECYGNMLQLCALQQICRNEQAQVDFVACEMEMPFNLNATRPRCTELVGGDWEEVTYCINNGLARQLKLEAERKTHRIAYPYPAFVPTVVYEGVFDQELQNRSQVDLKAVVCEQLEKAGYVAAPCATENSSESSEEEQTITHY